ncbi:MAG: tetratricopeptide repeat protein [Planctomycetota bacterium]
MTKIQLALLFLALVLPASIGCKTKTNPQAEAQYQTMPQEPAGDTAKALILHEQALTSIDEKQWEQAEQQLKLALTADITFGPAHNTLGLVYYQQRKYYLAAWEFQYAQQLMPRLPEPRNNLGLVFEAVGELDQAIQHYEAAYQLAPDDAEILGNYLRSRVRHGDRGLEIRDLLRDLILKDERPEWVTWARRTLAEKQWE